MIGLFNAFAKVSVNTDKTKNIQKALNALKNMDVLVGVPEENSSDRETGDITNAELAYIHTHGIRRRPMIDEMDKEMDQGTPYSKAFQMYLQTNGSPLWQSPPRPIIEPAIEDKDNNAPIAGELKQAVEKAMEGDLPGAENHLAKAGMLGQNAARDWFTNPKNGWPANAESTIKQKGSDQPLIDTGELRKAITYVVRKKK